MSQRIQQEVYHYTLNIISITMKIKFNCTMHLEDHGHILTPKISDHNHNGKYAFNHQITLKQKESQRNYFELTIHLTTERGALYIGGVIKISQEELIRSEGQRLVIPVTKCMDSEAVCELRVDQVHSEKVPHGTLSSKKKLALDELPSNKKNNSRAEGKIGGQTKSEYNIPIYHSKQNWEDKSKYNPQLTSFQYNRSPLPYNYREYRDNSQVAVPLEVQIYRQGYQKLKEKYRKEMEHSKTQLNKRISLQNSENNFKLDIMRLKFKCQESQNQLSEKASKIKELQGELAKMQKKELDLNYLREQLSNKDHGIRMLQDTIKTLNKDNAELKLLNSERFNADQLRIKDLKEQNHSLKLKAQTHEFELGKELKIKAEALGRKEIQLQQKNQVIERSKRQIEQLENTLQNKVLEHEYCMNSEKEASKKIQQQLKEQIQSLEELKFGLQSQVKQLQQLKEKQQNSLIRAQYDKQLLERANESYRLSIQQYKVSKQKLAQLTREHRNLAQDKSHLQQQLEKIKSLKGANMDTLSKQYQEQLEYYKKANKQLQTRNKALNRKAIDEEANIKSMNAILKKAQKTQQSLAKENDQLKGKEKASKALLHTKDQLILELENKLGIMHSQTHNSEQLLLYQNNHLKEELELRQVQLTEKQQQLNSIKDKYNQLQIESNKITLQFTYQEQKNQREQHNHKETVNSLKTVIEDYEGQISTLNQMIAKLQKIQKEQLHHIQELQTNQKRIIENTQQIRKQLKIQEDKTQSHQILLNNKEQQNALLIKQVKAFENKLSVLEQELSKAQININKEVSEKNKNNKIIELLNKNAEKYKLEEQQHSQEINAMEARDKEHKENIKALKEEITKLEVRNNSLSKEITKLKESLISSISTSFAPLLDNYLDESDKLKNKKDVESPKNIQNTDVVLLFSQKVKQARNNLLKIVEHGRVLSRENERLNYQLKSSSTRFSSSQNLLKEQFSQLEEELAALQAQREEQQIKYQNDVSELNGYLREKESVIKDLQLQLEELQLSMNNMKMDYESILNDSQGKEVALRTNNKELNETIEAQQNVICQLEEQNQELEEATLSLKSQLTAEKESSRKKDRVNEDLLQMKNKAELRLEEYLRGKKQMLQKISDLELHMNNQRELKEKYEKQLETEEKNNNQLKQFVTSLMQQKENAIKNELEKSQISIDLETQLLEVRRDCSILTDENTRIKKTIQELKEANRKTSQNNKQTESGLHQEKIRNNKLAEKLKEKERQLVLKNEICTRLEQKNKKSAQKYQKEIAELQEELEEKQTLSSLHDKETQEKALALEKEIISLTHQRQTLSNQISLLQEAVFTEKQKNESFADSLLTSQKETGELSVKVEELEAQNAEMREQLREKQEKLFEFSGKIYSLKSKLEAQQIEFTEKMESLNNQHSYKCDNLYKQHLQRIQRVQTEKNNLFISLQQKQQENKILLEQIRHSEFETEKKKKIYQEKIKALESSRLALLSQKNLEVQRISEECKQNFENLKTKESEVRKLSLKLEIAQNNLTKQESRASENQETLKNMNKSYLEEMEQLRKRENASKASAEQMMNWLRKAQREMKKTLRGAISKVLQNVQQKQKIKMAQILRELQQALLENIDLKSYGC